MSVSFTHVVKVSERAVMTRVGMEVYKGRYNIREELFAFLFISCDN